MIESSIARRYARALFELGRETGRVVEFFTDVEALNGIFKSHADLLEVTANRYLDLQSRLLTIDQIAGKMGLADEVRNFTKLLIRKGRVRLMDSIVAAYKRFLFVLENKEEATIVTARPLADDVSEKIRSVLEQITQKKIVTRTEVRPEVLGGMAVRIGGEIFDGTVKGDLDRISEQMKDAIV